MYSTGHTHDTGSIKDIVTSLRGVYSGEKVTGWPHTTNLPSAVTAATAVEGKVYPFYVTALWVHALGMRSTTPGSPTVTF